MTIKKKLISIALPICVLANSIPTMAATSYTTTNADSKNIETPITNDSEGNKVDVNVTQASTFSVTIPKTIVLDGGINNANEATYTINVSGNIASDEAIIIEPDTTFTMSDVKKVKDDLEGSISQTITRFVDKEINIDDTLTSFQHIGDTTGTVSINNLTSGEWAGSFNFNIKLHTHSFNETIENEATIEEEGSQKLSCEECGLFINQSIPKLQETLNGYTWDEVQAICKAGKAKDYFEVGDTAVINLGSMNVISYDDNETVLTLDTQTATIVVGDISSDGKTLTMLFTSYSTLAPTYNMNTTNTNVGGWAATSMRTWLNGEYYNALPNDLQKVITSYSSTYSETYKASTVLTCEDKLWLLSAKEVFGGDIATSAGSATGYENLAAFNAETQLAYFANDNSKIRYKSGTSACAWWLRSSYYNNSKSFTGVDSRGSSYDDGAYFTYFVFPAFCVG